MKKILLFTLVLFAFAACKKDSLSPTKTIVGTWHTYQGSEKYYLKGKLVYSKVDTVGLNTLDEVWLFDASGNLTISAYVNGSADHNTDQKFTYTLQNDSLAVTTAPTAVIKEGLTFPDNNTFNLTISTTADSPVTITNSSGTYTADKQTVGVTFKRM